MERSVTDQPAYVDTASDAECFQATDESNEMEVSEADHPREISNSTDEQSLRTSVMQWSKKYTEEDRFKLTQILRHLGKTSQTDEDTEDNETVGDINDVEDLPVGKTPCTYTDQDRRNIVQMVKRLGINGDETVDGIEDVEDLIVLVTSSGSRAIDEMMSNFKSMDKKYAKWNNTREKKKDKKKHHQGGSKLYAATAKVGKQEQRPRTSSSCLYSHFFNTLGEWIFMAPISSKPFWATPNPRDKIGNQTQVSGADVRRARNETAIGRRVAKGDSIARGGQTAAAGDRELTPDEAEQHSLRTWLRVAGIEETRDENTKQIVLTMAATANVAIESKDILQATRQSKGRYARQRREIFVKFASEQARQKLYNARFRVHGVPDYQNVYINDILSKERQRLFNEAMSLKRADKLKQVWTTRGEIFVRDRDSNKHHISCYKDLHKVVKHVSVVEESTPEQATNEYEHCNAWGCWDQEFKFYAIKSMHMLLHSYY